MKKILFLICFSFVFFSCKSSGNLIPGFKQLQIQNLYAEYMSVADAYFEVEKYDKAAEFYKKAGGSKDFYWNAQYKLAKTYAYLSKWQEALNIYELLLERDPQNLALKSSVAYLKAMSGDISGAEEIYVSLMEEQGENSEHLENLFILLLNAGRYDEAELRLDELSKKFPDNANLKKYTEKLTELKDKQNQENKNSTEENNENTTSDSDFENSQNETSEENTKNPDLNNQSNSGENNN